MENQLPNQQSDPHFDNLNPVHPNQDASSAGGGLPDPVPPKRSVFPKKLIYVTVIVILLAAAGLTAYYLLAHKHKAANNPLSSTQTNSSGTGQCAPNAILVNPCRPWIGAAAAGNPGAAKDQVSQFQYLEKLIGRPLDVYRDYHSYPGSSSSTKDQPLNAAEIYFAKRADTYVDVNWNPASDFQAAMAVSQGGNPAINQNIDKVAASMKSIAPHKVFLSIWHEANLAISRPDADSGQCAGATTGKRAYGSPGQFNAAWRNVHDRFKADGVTNVVWVMNYASYAPKNCWVKYLWPGNQYVDWVIYDTYSHGKNWDQTAGAFYKTLQTDSSAAVDFDSKPWGIGEFGTCKQTSKGITQEAYYQSVKAAIDANTYPKLKMYLVYADTGNGAGEGCLTNYDDNGQADDAKQTVFNQLVNDPVFSAK